MKKLMGGLLIMALVSNPSAFKVGYIMIHLYKPKIEIVEAYEQNDDTSKSIMDVSSLITMIDENNRFINIMLKNKYDVVSKIQSQLTHKAANRIALEDSQIEAFCSFNNMYKEENLFVNKSIELIHDEKLVSVKKSIAESKDEYDICKWLIEINSVQEGIFSSLMKIIKRGSEVLAVL